MSMQNIDVMKNRFVAYTEEAASLAFRAAHTTFVKQTQDFGVSLATPEGEFFGCPTMIGATSLAGQKIDAFVGSFADDIAPGDVLITNDPYRTDGLVTHSMDIHMARPIFHDGELVCFAWSFFHASDIGGAVPGSISPSHDEIFQEGIVLPPMKFAKADQIDDNIRQIILANSRIGEDILGDIASMSSALSMLDRRMTELCRLTGRDAVRAGMDGVLEYSERKARQVIAGLKDGTYCHEDVVELAEDQTAKIQCKLTIDGDQAEIDYTGSSPQVRAALCLHTGTGSHQFLALALDQMSVLRRASRRCGFLTNTEEFEGERPMTKTLYVGLDVHKDTIAVAVADEGRGGEIRFFGTIEHKADSVLRLTKQLAEAGKTPTFCYEAGPCGYGLHRHLTKLGFECAVVAPAMIPRKAGDRVKTDRRDAEMLARLWRAGELTPIWTPDEEQEAMRDLIRTRKQAMDAVKVAKQQLLSFLLRHGLRYENGSYWTKRHRRWLAELRRFRFDHQQLAFEELKRAVDQAEARVASLDQAVDAAVQTWRFAPVVDALRALRGVNTTIAATVVAEIGDITRFENPRQLMAWLGLVPSEHSSGSTTRRGRLTKTGNALARTMLVEAGWSYRHPPKEGQPYLKRSEHLPQEIKDIGWKAQTRLCKRFRHLSNTGKPQPRVLAAIARELAGFIWDIARKTPLPA